jgi:protein involved in polysaccharide export with SLBB domain
MGIANLDFEPDQPQRIPEPVSAVSSAAGMQSANGTPQTRADDPQVGAVAGVNPVTTTSQQAGSGNGAQAMISGHSRVDPFQNLAAQVAVGGDQVPPIDPSLPDCPTAWQSYNPSSGQTYPEAGVNCNVRLSVLGGTTVADEAGRTFTENTTGADRINNVHLPAPDIDWSYAVIERLDPTTFKTTLIPFDLGKLVVEHDPAQDLPVEPGDIVTIFSQADIRVPEKQQTKLVRLEGEVVHAGIYSVQPGETLRQLVERAGGLTENAYLYGADFTRASTRAAQQARIDDYVSTLELEEDRAAVATSATALSSLDTASSQATLSATQLLITKLKLLRASGRIVLNLKPGDKDVAALPALMLQDGDRLVVPSVPPSVNVVGAVYDPSSFIFDGKGRVGAYLHQAGGPNRDADTKHVFIVRADGAVVSKEASKSFWGNTFEEESINPGDTIVVPEKVYRGSALRSFSNIAGIVTGIGSSIATLGILAGVN